MIFGDALQRLTDEADAPVVKVVRAAEVVEDLAAVRVRLQGVYG